MLGSTVVGIRYRLQVGESSAAITNTDVTWGFIVAGRLVDPDDLDPQTSEHLDWMEWGTASTGPLGVGGVIALNGFGDDGFRTVRSMRKIAAVEENLRFVIVASTSPAAMLYRLGCSVVLKLP